MREKERCKRGNERKRGGDGIQYMGFMLCYVNVINCVGVRLDWHASNFKLIRYL